MNFTQELGLSNRDDVPAMSGSSSFYLISLIAVNPLHQLEQTYGG